MSEDRERRKSGFFAFLELGLGFLELGWRSLEFLSNLVERWLPPKLPPERLPKSGRDEDRALESESQMLRRERVGTGLVVCFFLITILGGIGFLIAYWSDGSNTQLLGGSLAVFLSAMGITLVLWAHWLMNHREALEPRHALASSPSAETAAAKAFCDGVHDVRRRRLLTWVGLSGAGLFGTMVLSLLRSLGMSPDKSLYSRIWQGGQRLVTMDGKPVLLSSLQPGNMVTVFPEDQIGAERAQTVLIRVKEQLLQLPEARASWAPGGYVAYSRVCTHAGCSVGEFETEQSILLCPCHQSTFDVLRAAAPTSGPAARPLPQLPLYADADGTLCAGGGFTAPPGPGFWGMP
jgi:ubiquinol-cytochrome c reductase iron-sulfur subunit